MVQRLDRKEIGLIVLNLPILNHDLGDPNLQKLIRNMIVQLLSWTAQNEREEIKRMQRQGIEIAKNPCDQNTVYRIKKELSAILSWILQGKF